jgi:hypothetical protein
MERFEENVRVRRAGAVGAEIASDRDHVVACYMLHAACRCHRRTPRGACV